MTAQQWPALLPASMFSDGSDDSPLSAAASVFESVAEQSRLASSAATARAAELQAQADGLVVESRRMLVVAEQFEAQALQASTTALELTAMRSARRTDPADFYDERGTGQ